MYQMIGCAMEQTAAEWRMSRWTLSVCNATEVSQVWWATSYECPVGLGGKFEFDLTLYYKPIQLHYTENFFTFKDD